MAAVIRALRPPDVYKLKGIRYANERLRKKAGKTARLVRTTKRWSDAIRSQSKGNPAPNPPPRSGKSSAAHAGRPRLAVFRSTKHIYAQVIDDEGRQDGGPAPRPWTRKFGPKLASGQPTSRRPKMSGQLDRGAAEGRGSRDRRLRPRWFSSFTAGSRPWPRRPVKQG